MIFQAQDLVKLGVALLVGAIIGAERERHRKPVGLRTLILISLGSALFTMISLRLGQRVGAEPSRIASNIVVGIGFLGAGAIIRERGRIVGLTTAATTWLVAALGMAAGAGEFILAGIASVIAILVLLPLARIEEYLEINTEERTYEITTDISWDKFKELKSIFKDNKMEINRYKQEKRDKEMVCTFDVMGTTKKHDKLVQKLLSDKDIKELWF